MIEKELVPTLRFKGFTDAWKQSSLNENVSYITSTLSISNAKKNGKYPLFDANNTIGFCSDKFVNQDYITIIKDGAGVGRVRLLPKHTYFIGTMGAMIPKNSDVNFDYALLEKTNFSNNIRGTTIPHIYFSDYGNMEIKICNLQEQTLIGNLFSSLDSLITLHQRKHEELQNAKKSLLQKMFPEGNNDKPSLRFKGFTDAWEQRKLNETMGVCGSGGTPLSSNVNFYSGKIPFLSISDISNSGNYIYHTEKHISELGLNSSAAWIVPRESISLAMYASVGKVAILKERVATSQAFFNFKVLDSFDRDFIFQYLKKMEYFNEWDPLISTGTQANLNAEKVKNLIIKIPKHLDEQNRVGGILCKLDSLITLHQRKYEKLQNIKKSLLERMFI